MSKLLREWINQPCRITITRELMGTVVWSCTVLDMDEEWVKVRFTDKKNKETLKLLRIENIEAVELIRE